MSYIYKLRLILSKFATFLNQVKVGAFVLIYSVASLLFILIINQQVKSGIYFLDVGQGDSILIISSSGNRILVDGGNIDGKAVTEIRKILPWFDRRIDLAIGTHADQDHVGGFTKVSQNFSINKFLFSHLHTSKNVEKNLFESLDRAKVSTSTINRGARISFGDDYINILYPNRQMKMTSDKDTNLFSIVARAHVATTTCLLTGDAPREVELKLVFANDDLHADVLKAGHHGSKNSTDPIFVSKVSPTYSIISAGKNNRYGHPHKETIENLKDTEILKTYELGTIKF